MEGQFRINWPAIVQEAKQRRKSQRLTQQRLATLAGVSTPTVSRFESGAKDIQLSSVTAILAVLGMVDERILTFPTSDSRYDSIRMVVLFAGKDGDKTVPCAISHEALEDHFDNDKREPAKVFRANRERIEHEARRKYLARRLEPDGLVLIKTEDLS
jgi:transcriptional regulator with XRE-family HTH domain